MRIAAISIGVLMVAASILTILRMWGLSLPVSEYQSDFFYEKKPWLAIEITTANEVDPSLKIQPDAILYLDLRLSSDHVLFVQAPNIFEFALQQKKFKQEDYKGRLISDYAFEFLKKEFPGIFPLEDILQKHPSQRMILNLIDNAKDIHKVTVELLRKYNLGKKIIIQSPTDIVLKSIKDLEPLWLYGTSQAELTRLLTLDSILVLPAASMRSDVLIAPLKIMKRNVFTESLNEELIRRKKKIMLGPLATQTEFEIAQKFKVDGYIFQNLSDFVSAAEKFK